MKKVINVCGTARSGSTMLDLILGNDDKGFSLGEIHAWFRPFRSHHFKINCSCDGVGCPWDELKKYKERNFYENAFRFLNVGFLVDSSKHIPWVVDNNISARKSGIQVYNILLFKEPISFFYSFWKRGVSIEEARETQFKSYYSRFFKTKLPFISLNYNNFVSNPGEILKKLCCLIDIPYFEGKDKFWERQYHHAFGSRGTRKQIEIKNSEVRSTEKYKPEFQKIIPQIQREINSDKTFSMILNTLKDSELNEQYAAGCSAEIKKPYWYYLSKLKQKFKKRFPEKWKYDQ